MGDPEAGPEMETVVITRAFKAAAAVMGFMNFLLLVVTTGATSWITSGPAEGKTEYYTYGLFEYCEVSEHIPEKVDAEGPNIFECAPYPEAEDWRTACQALMAVSVVVQFVSFILLTVGICSVVEAKKFLLYKVAVVGHLLVVVLSLVALIVYPTLAISTYSETAPASQDEFENYSLGWVYVVAWINTVVIFICALTVIIDKGDELTEREKVPEEEEE